MDAHSTLAPQTKRVHFAEEWNEFHHLMVMEALGGDQLWRVRFLAQHAAIVYYWVLVALWAISPSLAYNFSELIEAHAVDTYGEFVDANRETLARLPAPRVARLYWNGPDLFLFDEFQTARPRGSRRPVTETLLDVFTNIRDDEAEHVATMAACQDPTAIVRVPRVEQALLATAVIGTAALGLLSGDDTAANVAADALAGVESGAESAEELAAAAAAFAVATSEGTQEALQTIEETVGNPKFAVEELIDRIVTWLFRGGGLS